MRIAVVSTPIFRVPLTGYGGLEQIAYEQAKGLAARGHDVLLIAPDFSDCPGATIIPMGPAGQIDEKMAFGGYREIKHGEQVVRRGSQGYWQALMDRDVILDHSWNKWSYSLKQEGRFKGPVLGWMHAPIMGMFQTMPPKVEKPSMVCISDDQTKHFEAFYGRPARRCYNGIATDIYRPLGLPRTDRFLFLARFSTVKSPDVAIQACLRSGKKLDLIGDTSITGEPEFLAQCRSMCDGERIRIVGGTPRGETTFWFSQSLGFLHLNNRFREPFGLAPVEAQACGNAVLCWDNGALRETVKHGETGFLVKSLDEAVDLLKSEAIHTISRDRCREWASQFSIESMVHCAEDLCREAIDTGGW